MSPAEIIKAACADWDPSNPSEPVECDNEEVWETPRAIATSSEEPFQAQTPVTKMTRHKKSPVRERLEDYPLFAWAAEQKRSMSDPMHSIGIDLNAQLPMESAAFLLRLVIDQSSSASSDVAGEGADDERQFHSEGR